MTARGVVAELLTEQALRWPMLEPAEPVTEGLDARDTGLARALYEASVRRWLTLAWLVQLGLKRPFAELEPAVRAVLILGAAQLALFDRIPAHAAIDESVEWAKRRVRPGAGGLVNAALRRVSEALGERTAAAWDGGADSIPLAEGSRALVGVRLPEDEIERLAAATSMPAGLVRRLAEQHGLDWARRICEQGVAQAPVVLSVMHAERALPEGWTRAHAEAGHAVWTGPSGALGELLAERGDVWAQDASSSGAVLSVRDLRPARIVDLCAGQGTKTRQLSRVFPEAEIVATDVDEGRFRTLREVFAGHGRVSVVRMEELVEREAGRAEMVLADVPCSNTGVMARRVEARYRAGPAALSRLVRIQREILERARGLISPGGVVLYATCSVDREENEAQARWASERFGWSVSRERRTLPGWDGRAETWADGSYSVVLGGRAG